MGCWCGCCFWDAVWADVWGALRGGAVRGTGVQSLTCFLSLSGVCAGVVFFVRSNLKLDGLGHAKKGGPDVDLCVRSLFGQLVLPGCCFCPAKHQTVGGWRYSLSRGSQT